MTVALLLAGGVDPHFKSSVPKQFVLVDDLPLFVYTLTTFQEHEEIDKIYFICLDGWQAMVESYSRQFNISKLEKIVVGGATGQESAGIGVMSIRDICCDEDVVVIHDAIRPLVTSRLISANIRACQQCGMGIAAITSMDAFMHTDDRRSGYDAIDRSKLVRIQTPQSYRYGDLKRYFMEAEERGIHGQMDVCTMISALGYSVNLSIGSEYNLKINQIEDIDLFKALKTR